MRCLSRALGAVLFLVFCAASAQAQQEPGRDVERLVEEVRQRETVLDRKAQELEERERTIVQLEARLDERLDELREIQKTIEERISDWEDQDGDRIKKLAKVYSAMPPARVAPLLENLDLDLATSIVANMRAKNSAAVLAAMNPEEALSLSLRSIRPLEPKPPQEGQP